MKVNFQEFFYLFLLHDDPQITQISVNYWVKERKSGSFLRKFILNRKDAKSAKGVFIALRAGTDYSDEIGSAFNPDEISATEISSRLNKCKKGLTPMK